MTRGRWAVLVGAIGAWTAGAAPADVSVGIFRQGEEVDRIPVSSLQSRAAPGESGSDESLSARELARMRSEVFAGYDAAADRLANALESVKADGAPDKSLVRELRAAVAGLLHRKDDVVSLHEQTAEFLRAHQLDAEILARCVATAARFEAALEDIGAAVERVADGDPGAAESALAALGARSAAAERAPLGPGPDPVGAGERFDAPEDGFDVPLLPAGGDGGGGTTPGPEFLAETPEIVFTPEIVSRAEALGNDPIRIFEFVRNEVANELYPGSRKGAAETLRQRRGNDTDQASLLIALLRAAGVPSRYVQATIEIPVDAFESWWASAEIDLVRAVISAEGMDGGRVLNGMGETVAVRKTHIYVEAYVPYGQYRGTGKGDSEPIWLRLDPSFTLHAIDDGADVVDDLDFDVDVFFADHISGFTPLTPIEAFEAEIQAWLDVNQPGSTVAEGLRTVDPVPQSLGLLPASMPYDIAFENAKFAELFDIQRYFVRFQLYGLPGVLLDHSVRLSDIAGAPVTLDYVGATPADEATIASFGGIYNTPPNLVNLLARLKAGGTVLTTSVVSVGSGRDLTLDLFWTQPNGGFNAEPQTAYPVIAGSANVFSIDPFMDVPGEPDFALATNPDALIESLLQASATGYQRMRNEGIRRLVPLIGASVQYDARPNRALNSIHVSYVADDPVDLTWLGLQVDIDERGRFNHDAVSRSGIRANTFAELYGGLDGMHSSILENRVFEDLFNRDAVSTIKILQLAADQGIPICTITGSVFGDCPGFSHAAPVPTAVNDAILAGRTVTIPRDPITVSNWTGTGWSAVSGGGGGYLIAGALAPPANGGATVDSWEEDFQFVHCATGQVIRATITSPPADAPDEKALFLRTGDPLSFAVSLVAVCEGGTTTQEFNFVTGLASRDYPTGSYELRVLDAVRKFAILEGDVWVDSNNDLSKNIFDDELEDSEPFVFWVNDDNNSSDDAEQHKVFSPGFNPPLPIVEWDSSDDKINGFFDLMDVAPLGLHLDAGTLQAISELGILLELRAAGMNFFESSESNVRSGRLFVPGSYWFSEETGLDQLGKPLFDDGGADGTLQLEADDFDGTNFTWLVFEAFQETMPGEEMIQMFAYGSDPTKAVLLDEAEVEILHMKDMYRSVSVRGAQTPGSYETEVTAELGTLRTTTVSQYPTTFTQDYGEDLWDADHVLIFVHGFNNSENEAEAGFQNLFRKLYLNGYRSELVTFKWQGDELPFLVGNPALFFDWDVENAFESSKGLMNLIQEQKQAGMTIDIAAHSLGNLIVLDALRRLAISDPGTKYIRNIIHIEAAVWNGLYYDRPPPDGSDYTALEAEQRATWDHWAADVPGQITGEIVNSYNSLDGALLAMIANDLAGVYRIRGPQPPYEAGMFTEWAYFTQDYRTPSRLAFEIPGTPHTNLVSFARDPMGTTIIPQTTFPHEDFNAATYNWDSFSHSGYRTDPSWKMWRWYREVMVEYIGTDD